MVPRDPNWPRTIWDMPLGRNVANIRHKNYFALHRAELQSMGFDFTVGQGHGGHGWNQLRAAVLAYQRVNGDVNVPDSFVVPHDLAWPQNLWSMKLGATLKRVRHGRAYCQHKAELERLGIEFTVNKKKRPRPDAGQGGDNGATAAGSLKVKLHRPSTDASLKVKLRRPVTPTSQ